jgi:hypothetical protein
MAAPFTTTPKVGVDLNTIYLAADIANGISRPKLGDQVWTTDGKRSVFAQANASIPASTAVATVNATTFLATASGGSYLSPAFAMATGDQGWFDAASV